MLDSGFIPHTVPRIGETPVDLRGESERARTRGYADGFAQGHRVGLERAEREQAAELADARRRHAADVEERATALGALRAAQDGLAERVSALSELTAERVEALAVELSRAILLAELSDPARSAAHALRRAVATVAVDQWVRVRFDERDARILRDDPDAAHILRDVEIIAVPGLGVGGAIVEIDGGMVDTRIAEAMGRVAAALAGDDDPAEPGEPV